MYRELNQWLVILRIFDKNNRIVHWFHHSGSRFVMQCGSWKIVVVPVFVTNILFSKIIVLEAKKSFTDSQLQSKELSGCNNLPSFLPPWQLSYLELWLKWIKHLHDWINIISRIKSWCCGPKKIQIKKSEILDNLQSFFFWTEINWHFDIETTNVNFYNIQKSYKSGCFLLQHRINPFSDIFFFTKISCIVYIWYDHYFWKFFLKSSTALYLCEIVFFVSLGISA